MNVQAEVSLYPLRTRHIGEAIERFVGELERTDLSVCKANMSTTLSGDVSAVFAALGEAFRTVAEDSQVVLILKASNACPLDGKVEGKMTDVG